MSHIVYVSFFLSMFGLLNFSIDAKRIKFDFSYLKFCYSLVIFALLSAGLYYQIQIYLNLRSDTSLLHGLLYMYPMMANSVICLLIIISSVYSSYLFVQFAKSSENNFILDLLVSNFAFNTAILEVLVSFIIFCIPYILDFWYYHDYMNNSSPLIYRAMSYIFVAYNFLSLNTFFLTLMSVKTMYEYINRKVEKLCCVRKSSNVVYEELIPAWNVEESKMFALRKLEREFLAYELIEGDDEVSELFGVRGQHHQLYQMCRVINGMFSCTNLALVAHHAILGVINSYWGLRQALSKYSDNDAGELIHNFRTAALSFLSIIWLVAPTIFLTAEVDRTQNLIQKSLVASKNKAFQSEVTTFALQLKMDKIRFSPFGFFELSNELLLSLFGAIVSYLVILLQYQIMLDEQA